ncbi:bifunctional UDP-sugar hydrolase/5'-nucleotidase [Halobacteriovorax sp. HLS]|uniref:bifunctional metallophosphatase/5'-nucleotidase n=1 Tax=Halobacteriovorax sp. HLS TaxID=2234000 RepID=UPI000FD7CF8A|nr:5'-nucleotidase C-terminal domain-containing protein [Halobacteriovorax sp. HLS]
MKNLYLFISLLVSFNSVASVVQILHTNDLHSYYDNTIIDPSRGSYAALKAKMDELEVEATTQGIPTLRFDAGDFLEGNLYYMADKGKRSFKIMEEMGFDAVAIGNHDWLMGGKELNKLLKEQPPIFEYLGANFKPKGLLHSAIRKNVKPYTTFYIDDIKLGVMGLTTNELFYKWRFSGGDIDKPSKVGHEVSKKMKESLGHDYVIALTHVGVNGDKKIIKNAANIDLLIGGHSHTAIMKPVMQKDLNGVERPIVQTGAHARFLGKLILRLEKGRPLQILDYDLIPIYSADQHDEKIDQFVQDSRQTLNDLYSEEFLQEVVGESQLKLRNSVNVLTPWTKLITDAIKDSVGADISFHSPGFGGASLPDGPITREMIFNTYPRVFDLNDKYGWYVYKVDVHGVVLKSLIRFFLKGQFPVTFSGVNFDLIDDENEIIDINTSIVDRDISDDPDHPLGILGKFLGIEKDFDVVNIRVNGEKIRPYRKYRVAMPEGIVVGGLGISGSVRQLLRNISKSDVTVWDAISNKVKEVGVITREYGKSRDSFRTSILQPRPKPVRVEIPYRIDQF